MLVGATAMIARPIRIFSGMYPFQFGFVRIECLRSVLSLGSFPCCGAEDVNNALGQPVIYNEPNSIISKQLQHIAMA